QIGLETHGLSFEHLFVLGLPEIMVLPWSKEFTGGKWIKIDPRGRTMEALHHVLVSLVEAGECDPSIHGPENMLARLEQGLFLGSMLQQLLLRCMGSGDVPEDASDGYGPAFFFANGGSSFQQ